MITNIFVRWAGMALAFGLPTMASAAGPSQGGRIVMRPPILHASTPLAINRRVAVRPVWSHSASGMAWGAHGYDRFPTSEGARRVAFGDAARDGVIHGHTRTGLIRPRPTSRFALRRDRGYGYGYGEGPGLYDGDIGPGRAIVGAGSGSVFIVGGGGNQDYGSTETGSSGSVGEGFAEPPLNTIGSGARIVAVDAEPSRLAGGCSCRADGPVVYRFGVGSYY